MRWIQRRLFFAVVVLSMAVAAWGQTQPDEVLRDRIAAIRLKIDTARDWHASDDQLGVLWHQLANGYWDGLDFQRAAEAFTQSLKLLGRSPERRHYAATLDDMGAFYLAAGRAKEAQSCVEKALAIYEGLGDVAGASRLRVNKAIGLLWEQRFAESEAESAKALESFERQTKPNLYDVVAGLIANSYAKCFQNRCDEGLASASKAVAAARAAFAKDSLEGVAAMLALGFEQWKTGDAALGDRTMREALEVVREKEDLPHAKLVDAELRVLTSYRNYLKASHRKVEVRQIEEEIARLRDEQTPVCNGCTVNAVALSAR